MNKKVFEQKDRDTALKRAKKFEKLFKEPVFDNILHAVDNKKLDDFKSACKAAKMDDSEIEWLWNYLKNMDDKYWVPVPDEAALTGW